MKSFLHPSLALLVSVLMAFPATAQDGTTTAVTRDLEMWSGVGLTKKLNKNIEFSVRQQVRTWHNATQLDEFSTDAGVQYRFLNNQMRFGGNYRIIRDYDNEDNTFKTEQRFSLDAEYRHTFNRLVLGYRMRYTNRNDVGETSSTIEEEDDDDPIHQYRGRLEARYNIRDWKFDPIVSVEVFRRYQEDVLATWNRLRFSLGTNYKLKNFGKLGVRYRMERNWAAAVPQTTGIVGLNLTYDLKNLKLKKN